MGARLMGFYLTIEQGDHLPQIADEHGFSDWHTIWDEALRPPGSHRTLCLP
jgi:hypothetical protein